MSRTSNIKSLLSDTMIYGMSSIVGRFLNYLLVPLYTYHIAANSGGYGIVTRIYALVALGLVILTFGMETTYMYYANKYRDRSAQVFSTAVYFVGGLALAFLIGLFCFAGPLSQTLGCAGHPEYLTMMGGVLAFDSIQAIFFAHLRVEHRAWKFAFLKLLFIFGNIGLNLFVFLVAPSLSQSHPALMGWYNPDYQVGYIFLVNLICTGCITLGFLPEMRNLRYGVNGRLMKEMLLYAWPILLLGIAGILNQVADKICYNFLVPGPEGDVQLGIYGACVKIAMIMAMITQAFRYAYEPFVFGGGKSQQSTESQAAVTKYFIIFALLAFLVVMGYLPIFKYVISSSYWEGLNVVPIVMMAEIFMSIYFNLSFWYKLEEKTWWGAIFSAIGCVVLLGVNFLFVPRYGYIACAWGGVAGYGVCMVLSYWVGRVKSKSPVPYPLMAIFGYFALALGLYAISIWLRPEQLGWQLAFNTLLIIIYLAVLCWNERALVQGLLRKVLHRA